ncbi:hypothetical protein NIES4075_47650 [Tolypothrix sp. NIES-4075]|jgi:hypothetical protein|nr:MULTISPECIES: hypothetical protein [Tolypothrichaceae]GAX43750.1 hypothetical protein NIES4075_47650 [Tolypothrix sp. NIES-4075]
MKRETLAELVARTVIEFEKREALLQKQQESVQQQQQDKPKPRKSKAA